MTAQLLALLLLAFTPAAASTGQTQATLELTDGITITPPLATIGETEGGGFHGPLIIVSSGWKQCDLTEFAKAAREVAGLLEASDRLSGQLAIRRSPSATLREQADEIDRRDAAIRAFREQLDKCGWMAEPGAFDR